MPAFVIFMPIGIEDYYRKLLAISESNIDNDPLPSRKKGSVSSSVSGAGPSDSLDMQI